MNFKTIRIAVLLLILTYIGLDTFISNKLATDWQRSLRVVIYPINADASKHTEKYIQQLQSDDFSAVNALLKQESKKYRKNLSEPLHISIAAQLRSLPPQIPEVRSGLRVLWWSIKLRFWSWQNDNYTGPKPQIKAYALYFDPKTKPVLEHSTGLNKAKIAINYLFADNKQTAQNNVVLLHELLHTLGASDKYDLNTGFPNYPDGFADRRQRPLYPQERAEIMGGRIPQSDSVSEIPPSLNSVVIGTKTAKEIGWIE